MWLTDSSIGRKLVMSITGTCLVLFLLFHASMNLALIFSEEAYNWICQMLGANWYALIGTAGLAFFVLVHFVYAFVLTIQNRHARGNDRYAINDRQVGVDWESQDMLVLGIIVILGLALHLINFWSKMMLPELMHTEDLQVMSYATNGVYHIQQTFSNVIYVVLYLVWLAALWFHLTHGFWSAMQTLGWNNRIWLNRWKCIGNWYTTIVVACFAVVVIVFYVKSLM